MNKNLDGTVLPTPPSAREASPYNLMLFGSGPFHPTYAVQADVTHIVKRDGTLLDCIQFAIGQDLLSGRAAQTAITIKDVLQRTRHGIDRLDPERYVFLMLNALDWYGGRLQMRHFEDGFLVTDRFADNIPQRTQKRGEFLPALAPALGGNPPYFQRTEKPSPCYLLILSVKEGRPLGR